MFSFSKIKTFSQFALIFFFLLTIYLLLNRDLLGETRNSTNLTNISTKSLTKKTFPKLSGSFAFHTFTDKDGLPQNSAMTIVFDQKGYLWVGTQDGATYYNGHKWTTVNMPNRQISNSVQTMLSTSDGSLWFGTNGAGLIQLKDSKWTIYDKKSGALANNIVNTLAVTITSLGQLTIWVGTETGLSAFSNDKWQTYTSENSRLPSDNIETLFADKDILWIGTNGGGLVKFENNNFSTNYNKTNSLLPSNVVKSLLITKNNNQKTIWIGTEQGLVSLKENPPNIPQWNIYNTNNSLLPHNIIRCIYPADLQSEKSAIWIGTPAGLAYFVESTNNEDMFWRVYNSQNSNLSGDFIVSLLGTYPENGIPTLWIGTNGGGLVRTDLLGWQTFSTKTSQLPNNIVRSLLEVNKEDTNKQLWVGTYEGLACLENEKWIIYNTTNSALPDNNVESLLYSYPNTLWIGSWGGLTKVENNKWTTYNISNSGLPENRVMSLLETTSNQEKTLWVGTTGGLACFQKGKWSTYTTKNSPLPHNQIDSILATESNNSGQVIWLGTWGGGLVKLEIVNNTDNSNLIAAKWTIYNTENSKLPNNLIKTLKETKNNGQQIIWIGTNGGLAQFFPNKSDKSWQIFSDSTTPALPNNIVSQIIFTPKQIFIFTFKGILRFALKTEKSDISDLVNFDSYIFTTEDGLPGNGVNPRAAILDSQNRLWVGTLYGLAMLDLKKNISDTQPKPLHIEQVTIRGKPFTKNSSQTNLQTFIGTSKDLPNNEEFSYYENQLVFEYTLLSYFKESETRYRVQLVGLDPKPSDWNSEHRKEYTNLSYGIYQFQVWAKDGQGNISGPVNIVFSINPPPWFAWWAILFYLSGIGGTIYVTIAWRIHVLTKRQQEKVIQLRQLQQERLETLRQLLKSIQIINSQLDLETVLQNITAESARLIDGEPGTIGLIVGENIVFKHLWYKGKLEDSDLIFPLGQGIAGIVAVTGKPYIVNDIHLEPKLVDLELAKKYSPYGFVEIPIIDRKGKVVGVLDIRRTANRVTFTEKDVQILESLAHQAAVAIENASLYGTLEEKNLALEEKNLIIAESLKEIENLYQHEQEVSRALQELNQMKSNFMVVTSHEMRTPLTILQGNHEALLAKFLGQLTPRQEKSLLACQRATNRMVESVENISEALKISEKQVRLKYSQVNLCQITLIVANKLSQFIQQRNQELKLNLPDKLIISADPDKLQLLLSNIIQNAIKFTPDQGVISVTINQEDSNAHIIITDNGIGIEKKDLERIFDQFYTHSDTLNHTSGKYQFSARGSGLGLAISKGYVESHSGRIWAESDGINYGSSFHIIFPIHQKPNQNTNSNLVQSF